jgi:hypothetical protein
MRGMKWGGGTAEWEPDEKVGGGARMGAYIGYIRDPTVGLELVLGKVGGGGGWRGWGGRYGGWGGRCGTGTWRQWKGGGGGLWASLEGRLKRRGGLRGAG